MLKKDGTEQHLSEDILGKKRGQDSTESIPILGDNLPPPSVNRNDLKFLKHERKYLISPEAFGDVLNDLYPIGDRADEDDMNTARVSRWLSSRLERKNIAEEEYGTASPQAARHRRVYFCGLCRFELPKDMLVPHPTVPLSSMRVCTACCHLISRRITLFQSIHLRCDNCRGSTPEFVESRDGLRVLQKAAETKLFRREPESGSSNSNSNEVSKTGLRDRSEEMEPTPVQSQAFDATSSLHMLAFLERYFLQLSPKALRLYGIEKSWEDWIAGASMVPKTEVSPDVITILFKAFKSIGAFDQYSALKWPIGRFELPSDVRKIVKLDSAETFEQYEDSSSPGMGAWNKAFPLDKWTAWGLGERTVFNNVFGLIGVRLTYKNQGLGANFECEMSKVDFITSVKNADALAGPEVSVMIRACLKFAFDGNTNHAVDEPEATSMQMRMLDDKTILKETLQDLTADKDDCEDLANKRNPRNPREGACTHLANKEINRSLCWSCGCHSNNTTYPLSTIHCKRCFRNYCSLCLSRVFGDTEYINALSLQSWRCMVCRHDDRTIVSEMAHENYTINVRPVQINRCRRVALKVSRCLSPLMIVNDFVQRSMQQLHDEPFDEVKAAFASYCEQMNAESIFGHGEAVEFNRIPRRCFACKRELANSLYSLSGTVPCSDGRCFNYFHLECATTNATEQSRWQCGWHQCSVCYLPQRDSFNALVRCKTCPTAYCNAHLPREQELHVYDNFCTRWISCVVCARLLDKPLRHPIKDASCRRAGSEVNI